MLKQLNQRAYTILDMIVEEYLNTGEPLGSRNISKRMDEQLSPASVRNVLASLQNYGLIHAPHVSAGRLPTDSGLRLFVEGILQSGNPDENECKAIEKAIAEQELSQNLSTSEVMTRAANMMAGLSYCAGLVSVPMGNLDIRHLEFVPLSQHKLMAVVVLEGGMVENIVLNMPQGVPMTALIEASNYLSTKMSGYPLAQAMQIVKEEIKNRREILDTKTKQVVESGLATLAKHQSEQDNFLIISGQKNLLDQVSGMQELEQIRSLFAILESKENLLKILESLDKGDGVRIFIGSDNELFSLAGCSIITASYSSTNKEGAKTIGTVGVIGPSRMNYARIIPLVDYTTKIIDRMIKQV